MKKINLNEYINYINEQIKKGVLLTTKDQDIINPITIGWGSIATVWNKNIFIAYIRESRYTHDLLWNSNNFTINIPFNNEASEILKYCGLHSGRDTNKINDLNLTIRNSISIDSPAIKELPMTLECKVIYKQRLNNEFLIKDINDKYYSNINDPTVHSIFYGEIINSYIIEE